MISAPKFCLLCGGDLKNDVCEYCRRMDERFTRIRAARAKLIKTRTGNSQHSSAKAPPVDFYSKTASEPQSDNQNVRKPYAD